MEPRQKAAIAVASAAACCFLAATECVREKHETNKSKGRRSCWVKPWREEREACGNIQSLLNEFKLAGDLKCYKSYLLMDEICFRELLSYIEKDISRKDTHLRKCIPADERLAATLRFLATGENFKELNENTKLSSSFLKKTVIEVCEAIYNNMKDKFLKFPDTKEKWVRIAEEYESRWQFPLCLGALDGKHISFTPSKKDAPLFYNYKGFHSIVLLAMADANAKFTFIDVGCNGRISDGGVFSRSDLMAILNQSSKYFPKAKTIGNNRTLPYVIVADNAFPLLKNVLTPFSRKCMDEKLVNFNTRLSRARQNIERAFGLLANRFQIFQKPIKLDQEKTKKIVQCCCVLHNFLIERSIWYLHNSTTNRPTTNENSNEDFKCGENRDLQENPTTKEIEQIRKVFANYFFYEGKISI